uniref:Uncharacterized protein n=1 Tax=Chromera velia CCMP2878 TaxID=1169474 RepID=A0A0G4G574_9ALVE|eukprot:Cvel_4201.t1-p1 / transcript=Cvel_4201.t1 / gene=Cvel_4201 / organism=Chromera_velia_CCMP2878 / gene_product=hypothetical protein / transcript_product=hypothetical protein / location=Cvel_scaffold181:58360-61072(-) / protein_length=809 / sequence_SO=supercontig / SO=protein_coding / is_pseudo=false
MVYADPRITKIWDVNARPSGLWSPPCGPLSFGSTPTASSSSSSASSSSSSASASSSAAAAAASSSSAEGGVSAASAPSSSPEAGIIPNRLRPAFFLVNGLYLYETIERHFRLGLNFNLLTRGIFRHVTEKLGLFPVCIAYVDMNRFEENSYFYNGDAYHFMEFVGPQIDLHDKLRAVYNLAEWNAGQFAFVDEKLMKAKRVRMHGKAQQTTEDCGVHPALAGWLYRFLFYRELPEVKDLVLFSDSMGMKRPIEALCEGTLRGLKGRKLNVTAACFENTWNVTAKDEWAGFDPRLRIHVLDECLRPMEYAVMECEVQAGLREESEVYPLREWFDVSKDWGEDAEDEGGAGGDGGEGNGGVKPKKRDWREDVELVGKYVPRSSGQGPLCSEFYFVWKSRDTALAAMPEIREREAKIVRKGGKGRKPKPKKKVPKGGGRKPVVADPIDISSSDDEGRGGAATSQQPAAAAAAVALPKASGGAVLRRQRRDQFNATNLYPNPPSFLSADPPPSPSKRGTKQKEKGADRETKKKQKKSAQPAETQGSSNPVWAQSKSSAAASGANRQPVAASNQSRLWSAYNNPQQSPPTASGQTTQLMQLSSQQAGLLSLQGQAALYGGYQIGGGAFASSLMGAQPPLLALQPQPLYPIPQQQQQQNMYSFAASQMGLGGGGGVPPQAMHNLQQTTRGYPQYPTHTQMQPQPTSALSLSPTRPHPSHPVGRPRPPASLSHAQQQQQPGAGFGPVGGGGGGGTAGTGGGVPQPRVLPSPPAPALGAASRPPPAAAATGGAGAALPPGSAAATGAAAEEPEPETQ